MNKNKTIINIISGKGGTGKTLMSAVLAEMLGNAGKSVLVVDLDVFVRGLTSLLYFHKGEALKLTNNDDLSISEIFRTKGGIRHNQSDSLSISRYRSFDVIPSVSTVNELLNFHDIMPNDKEEAEDVLQRLIHMIPEKYDVVLLDSRAGYDELISATHHVSDMSICVEEDDNISMVTAENLIEQLKKDDSKKNIFRIRNKVRSTTIREKKSHGFTFLGDIPFDIDVMNSFGSDSFWEDISRSLYKGSLAEVWNTLSKKMDLGNELDVIRVSPVGSKRLEKKLQMYKFTDRLIFLYSLIIGIIGLIYGLWGHQLVEMFFMSPIQLVSFIIGLVGLLSSIFISVRRNKK